MSCPSVRLSVRMNAEISETIRLARLFRFGVQIYSTIAFFLVFLYPQFVVFHVKNFNFSQGIFFFLFYTLAVGVLISVRSLQHSEGDVSDPIKYIYS